MVEVEGRLLSGGAVQACCCGNVGFYATSKCSSSTQGEVAIKLARSLRQQGVYRTYALQGGFAAWRADGLPVEEGNVNYDVNAIEAITEEAEALLQTTQARIVSTPVRPVVGMMMLLTMNLVDHNHFTNCSSTCWCQRC